MAAGRHLGFDITRNSAIRTADPENPTLEPNMKCIWDYPLRRYGRLKFFHDGGGRHLEFVRTGNSAIRSAVAENPTVEQNMKWIGRPVAEISPLEIFPLWRWPLATILDLFEP